MTSRRTPSKDPICFRCEHHKTKHLVFGLGKIHLCTNVQDAFRDCHFPDFYREIMTNPEYVTEYCPGFEKKEAATQ
jgi:hypothetical protein